MFSGVLSAVFVPSETETLIRTPPEGIELVYVAEAEEFGPENGVA